MASRAILSNFFEKQWTQNHPQYFLGLSLALFPATFLEITIYDSVTFDDVFNCHTLMTESVIIGMAMNKTKTF